MKCADNREELFPVVDAAGRVVGRATRGECHGGSMLLHPVVHLHLFNSCGELYLQKRPAWKDIQPGRWDTAVGGHVDWGEEPLAALRREVREEVGVTDFEPQHVLTYLFESERERELRDLYPQFRRRDPPCGGAAGCRALSPRFRSLRLFGTQGGLPSGDR